MPLTKVTTAITAATPMTTPISVRAERSLFAQSDWRAIRMASEIFILQLNPSKSNSMIRRMIPGVEEWELLRLPIDHAIQYNGLCWQLDRAVAVARQGD